jgi:PAS domain S-box-containing protein
MGGQGLQLAGLRKDGSEFSVDVMLSPLRGNIGPMTLCVVRDVTERVHTERLMRDLLESAPDAMVIVNAQGRIELVNSQTETVFGFARQELLGQPIEVLIPQRFRAHHPQYRSGYHANPRVRPMGEELQLYGLRKDGSEMPIEISLSPLKTSNGTLVVSAIRDISSRKRAEQLILDSLKEKEVLLKEIHHRVKNNLAVISSLFSLQSNNLDDEHLKTILRQSQDRVRSMALVHETLYSHNLAEVDFTEYVTSLSAQLLTNYSLSTGQVQLVTELEPILLSIDMAVPCGLILNELITNALKHGLQDGRAGRLLVALRRTEPGRFELEVSDDGCGLPPDFDLASGNSLGKRLIRSLVKQLNGQVQFTSAQPGTRVLLTLPLPARKESGT